MAKIDGFLKAAVDMGASDLHIAVGSPPLVRQFGELKRFKFAELTPAQTKFLLYEILTEDEKAILEKDWELDFAYEIPGLARFRANAFHQRKGIDLCFRVVRAPVPSFEQLRIPDIIKKVCENHQGLVLITGAAGTGKSTTLAAIVDYINDHRAHHVLSVEDPIEYIHPVKKSAINQRQIGRDTKSYGNALKAALREDPDVIVVGEMRDLDTITLAISASETGHLVIGSMNTSSAHKTIDKIIDSYPPGQQNQIRAMLGESLKAIFTQRLLPKADNTQMVLAYELLLGSPQLGNLIKEGKTFQIPNIMQTMRATGVRTMDDTLLEMVKQGLIAPETAYKNASNVKLFAQYAPKGEAPATAPAPAAAPAAAAPARSGAPRPGGPAGTGR